MSKTAENEKRILARNINRYLSLYNKNQKEVADAIKVSPQTFNTWAQAKAYPRAGKIQSLADYFGIAKTDLIDDKSNLPNLVNAARIPVLGYVAAGIPIDAIQEVLDWEEIPSVMAETGKYFGLRIKGDSMEPRICEGDTVIVRAQSTADSGDTVIVQVNGNEATCKKLKITETGISLISLNAVKYDPMEFTKTQIKELPVTIIGRVVELRGKF